MTSVTLTERDAFAILELPVGADKDAIRTSYKRLAQKWHPEKHNRADASIKNFEKISQAYKRLDLSTDQFQLTPGEMYDMYQITICGNSKRQQLYLDDEFNSSDSDVYNSSDEEANDLVYMLSRGASKAKNPRDYSDDDDDDDDLNDDDDNLTAEQREKFANELISEEEQKKRRLEKRRAKKKLRREKKRLEREKQLAAEQQKKLEEASSKKKGKVKNGDSNTNKENKDKKLQNDVVNPESEFSQLSQTRKPETKSDSSQSLHSTTSSTVVKNDMLAHRNDPIYNQSRQFAIDGNAYASRGEYREAIKLFSQAIQVDSSDFRFYGNRSFCHERLNDFNSALQDACRAISLAPEWPKGYYRQGIAFAGLKMYTRAEAAFMQVLKLDSQCDDARQELYKVRALQLMDMGFGRSQADLAVHRFDSVQQALDCLLSGLSITNGQSKTSPTVSPAANHQNGQTSTVPAVPPHEATKANAAKKAKSGGRSTAPLPPIPQSHYEEAQRQILLNKQPLAVVNDIKMNPHNPEGLTSLWVGNVQPHITQDELLQMFSKYGVVQSVRCLPDKYCAFVNFYSKECAGIAMKALQGMECGGQNLLIKFPDNPIQTAGSVVSNDQTTSKPIPTHVKVERVDPSVKQQLQQQQLLQQQQREREQQMANNKVSGPVNGNECYFWRTTGCQFAAGCRYRHIPANKGIDKKPWHKSAK